MSGGYYLADVYSYFQPLTEWIRKDDYARGMIPGLMQPSHSEWSDGQQIGVPYGVDAYGLLVNTDILGKAGVAPASLTDWDAVAAACEKIEAAAPGVACLAHSTGNPEQIGAFFFSAYAGPFVGKDGHYALDVDKAVAAAAVLPKLWKHLPKNGAAMSFDEAGALFRDGHAAMLVDWPSFVSKSLDADASAVKGKWQQVRFPGAGFPWLSLWQLFVPKTAPDPQLAWAWIKTFAGPEHARDNFVEHNIGSVWLALYDDPVLKAQHAHQWPALVEGFFAGQESAAVRRVAGFSDQHVAGRGERPVAGGRGDRPGEQDLGRAAGAAGAAGGGQGRRPGRRIIRRVGLDRPQRTRARRARDTRPAARPGAADPAGRAILSAGVVGLGVDDGLEPRAQPAAARLSSGWPITRARSTIR